MLAPGGLFAFTVESHAGEGVVLGEGLRYAHGAEPRVGADEPPAAPHARAKLAARHRPAPRAATQVPGLVVVAAKR